MSESAVQEILERIDNLPEAERLLLEQRLAERLEVEWQREAAAARAEAQRRGFDQAAIERAVEETRYPWTPIPKGTGDA
jgi:SOS response regulatory protein OraA/RecX